MKTRTHGLDEREMELVKLLIATKNSLEDLEKSLEKLSKSASSYVSNQKTISSHKI